MRRWIKIWTRQCLQGSIRFDFSPAERGVWYDLLVLAGHCIQDGIISMSNGVAYPHSWIAVNLNIPRKLLETVLAKCQAAGRITEDETGIRITNWKEYQSEYERQRKYRQQPTKDTDPDKYVKGKYGHMVWR